MIPFSSESKALGYTYSHGTYETFNGQHFAIIARDDDGEPNGWEARFNGRSVGLIFSTFQAAHVALRLEADAVSADGNNAA